MAALATKEKYLEMIHVKDPEVVGLSTIFFWQINVQLAFTHLKLGKPEAAIEWALMTFESQKLGGTDGVMSRIVSHLCIGRARAELGQMQKATAAFEAEADLAAKKALTLLEVWAWRDLKTYVLDKQPGGANIEGGGAKNIGAAIRKLEHVEPSSLNPVLSGLDGEAMVRAALA
eukprot:SAG22_NODE_1374_length_4563_cov_1.852823_3_plen_174_part_00